MNVQVLRPRPRLALLRPAAPVPPPPPVALHEPQTSPPSGPPPRRSRAGLLARLCGPGAVVAVAYVDPGNFATNASAGAALGSTLLWVVLVASAAAMLVQYLSAKAGAMTGKSLPELCREHYSARTSRLLWVQAEVVAMATDLAEVVGGAIALYLLFGVPMPVGGCIVAAVGVALLMLRPGERRRFQVVIALLLALVAGAFLFSTVRLGVDVGAAAAGLVPSFGDDTGLMLATGIVGATVMPHAIYLHSALTRQEHRRERVGAALRRQRRDLVGALTVAALVNAAILLVAARALHVPGSTQVVDTLEGAYAGLAAVSPAVGLAFVLALLVSGLASTGVGTYAGDVVMQGFLRRRVPLPVRRAVTLAPALLVLSLPVDPTAALIVSQVVLSFGVPFALVPLLHLTARRSVLGSAANRPVVTGAAGVVAVVICCLNAVLLWEVFT